MVCLTCGRTGKQALSLLDCGLCAQCLDQITRFGAQGLSISRRRQFVLLYRRFSQL